MVKCQSVPVATYYWYNSYNSNFLFSACLISCTEFACIWISTPNKKIPKSDWGVLLSCSLQGECRVHRDWSNSLYYLALFDGHTKLKIDAGWQTLWSNAKKISTLLSLCYDWSIWSPCLQNNAMSNFRRAVTMGMPCSSRYYGYALFSRTLKAHILRTFSISMQSLSSSAFILLSVVLILFDTNVKSSHCIACLEIFKGKEKGECEKTRGTELSSELFRDFSSTILKQMGTYYI